jgi:hypothetical protein
MSKDIDMADLIEQYVGGRQVSAIDADIAESLQYLIVRETIEDWDAGSEGDHIVGQYNKGDDSFRAGFNCALIWIVGYTLPTLMEKVERGEDEQPS